jgi:adenine phosphoribosyltransferase
MTDSSSLVQPKTSSSADPENAGHAASDGNTASSSSTTAELSDLALKLRKTLRQYPDFPSPGILFEDIFPIFSDVQVHGDLIRALELHIATDPSHSKPDVLVALEARGFLFAPSLALRLGCSFVPVRKKGKLPGETVEATYQKVRPSTAYYFYLRATADL